MQIYNVYSLGLAILSVVFLQWLLLYQRHHHDNENDLLATSSVDVYSDAPRPPSPEVVIPSITITNPTPMPDDEDNDDDHDDDDDNKDDAESVEAAETNSTTTATGKPASPVSDDDSREILPNPSPMTRPRSNSVASVNVLQTINEQRRFSVSATSAKSASAGGVTGQFCAVIYYLSFLSQ